MRVLISGGGIAGPTFAYFLSRIPSITSITILEKAPELLPYGQNIDIQGSARRVIHEMALTKRVLELNTTEKGTQFISPTGDTFAPFPVKKDSGASSFTSEFEILRGDLAKIFYEATKGKGNIKWRFGTSIKKVLRNEVPLSLAEVQPLAKNGTSASTSTSGAVEVELSDGSRETYDLLCAADGQWSKIRRETFIDANDDIEIIDKGMYAVYFTIPRIETEDNNFWNVYQALGSKIITTRPDPHGALRAMFTCMPLTDSSKEEWKKATRSGRSVQEALIHREFKDIGWIAERLLNEMSKADDFYFQPIQQVKMKSDWYKNRIICLGDAAYAPSPLTGMGTSLAILGGYVLAGELSKVLSDEATTSAVAASSSALLSSPSSTDSTSNGVSTTELQTTKEEESANTTYLTTLQEDNDKITRAFANYQKLFKPFVEEEQWVPSIVPGVAHPNTSFQRWLFHTFISALSKVLLFANETEWIRKSLPTGNEETFKLPDYQAFERDHP